MNKIGLVLTVVLASTALAGCGKKAEAPKGQVVATVDGHEITSSELKLEMGTAPSDPAIAAAAQQGALAALINRQLFVDEAKRRGLDKSPMAEMVRNRAEQLALVQLLQMSIASSAPKVSDGEAADFVKSHPTSFQDRKLISVDQLVIPQIAPALIKQMEPINTLEGIIDLLSKNNVPFVQSAAVLDTVNMNEATVDKITGLGVNGVFVTPNGAGASVSKITGVRNVPLTGNEANLAAKLMMAQQRGSSQVSQALGEIVKNGQSKVQINPQYQPKKSPAPAPSSAN